jgi:PKD repeat protein
MLLLSHLAVAQHWPLQSDQPNVEATCTDCLLPNKGLHTVAYSGAIKAFVGRYADSTTTRDYQQTFRTARAGLVRFAPERNRVYMALGSAVVAYNLDTFFSRLAAREPMIPATNAPVSPGNSRTGAAELYLRWNKFFYAENTPSGWITPLTDGQDRLYSFDWDDRGYMYIGTSSYFGWGIVVDDGGSEGGLMQSQHQEYPSDDYPPSSVISLKSAGHYYLIIPGVTASAVWDVTVPTAPVRKADLNVLFGPVVKMPGNRIAFIGVRGLVVYSVDTLLAGGGPDLADASSSYLDLATDGTNLFAVSYRSGQASLTTFAPDQSGHFVAKQYTLSQSFQPSNVNFGGGYLAVGGSYGDTKLFKLDASLAPTEVPTNGYFGAYYSNPPAGYAKADFTSTGPVYPYQQGSNVYLVVPAHGLGDVYLIDGNVTPPKPTCDLNSNTVAISFAQDASPCNPSGGVCAAGQTVSFDVNALFPFDFSACGTHTFAWSFSDGQHFSSKSFTRTFGPGTYGVDVTVSNATGGSVALHSTLLAAVKDPPPLCLVLDANAVALSFSQGGSACGRAGGACAAGQSIAFDVNAVSGYNFNCATHTFAWTFGDGQTFSSKSFSRQFSAAGDYPVDVTVDNGRANVTLHSTVHVTGTPPLCGDLNANVVALYFYQDGTTCGPNGGDCTAGQNVTFDVSAFQYSFSCASHTFSWVFGDGQRFNTKTFSRVFKGGGDVPVDLTVSNGLASVTIHAVVHVPGVNGCADVNAGSTSITFSQDGSTTCGPSGGACTAGQNVSFDVAAMAPSSFACASHTFTWSFSDGQHFNTKACSRLFTSAGDYPVDLTVGAVSGGFTIHSTVHVGGGVVVGPCGTMNDNTVFLTYQGPASQCTSLGGSCNAGEAIAFKVNDYHPAYTFTCATHTFTWDFGDGTHSQPGSLTTMSHAYSAGGAYTVKVTVNNGSTTFDSKSIVTIGTPATPIDSFDFTVAPWVINGVRIPNGYLFTPYSSPSPSDITWNWDFGDGSKGVTTHDFKSVTHTYDDSNDHTVSLSSPQGTGIHSHDLRTRRHPGR